jgi:hypothetical protein
MGGSNMSFIADKEKYPANEFASFKYQGIPFDDVNPNEDEGELWSQVCGDHLMKHFDILDPIKTMVCKVNNNCQCGVYGCEEEAQWYVEFPTVISKEVHKTEKYVFIVRSFERIDLESQQVIYGVFEKEEDAIACFNKVLSNEKEGGYFSDDDYSPFRNGNFSYLDEYHIFNENDESDWWEFEIFSIPLNRSLI